GTGIHFTVPVAKDLNARFGVNYFDFSHSASTNNVNYDFKLKLNTWDALLDYHPFSSGFRLTGGLIYNANKIDAHAKPNGNGTYT
ncbi:hypothetical protein, partial [Enterococcus faecalis]|uniref:hypothetical protein n=1 Tax=Enterococcus faecalis TaxID=1351 RepID=UPI003CC6454B